MGRAKMNIIKGQILLAAIAVAALIAAGGWYQACSTLGGVRAQVTVGELQPIATLVKESRSLLQELESESFAGKDLGILESYLAKIRRDGVGKHADMKQRLDALAENDTAIVTLLKAYSPHARTVAFIAQGDKFRNYAAAWRDRWNSVMELFMAGGNYPGASAPFPVGFSAAVEAEIAAAK